MQANPSRNKKEPLDKLTKKKTKNKKTKKPFGIVMYSSLFNFTTSYIQWYNTKKDRNAAFENQNKRFFGSGKTRKKQYVKIEKIER